MAGCAEDLVAVPVGRVMARTALGAHVPGVALVAAALATAQTSAVALALAVVAADVVGVARTGAAVATKVPVGTALFAPLDADVVEEAESVLVLEPPVLQVALEGLGELVALVLGLLQVLAEALSDLG